MEDDGKIDVGSLHLLEVGALEDSRQLSLAAVGVLAETLGAQAILIASGALIAVVGLLTLASASVRRL